MRLVSRLLLGMLTALLPTALAADNRPSRRIINALLATCLGRRLSLLCICDNSENDRDV